LARPRINLALMVGCSVGSLLPVAAGWAREPAPVATAAPADQQDIVVTANRREEAIQKVGVSVQAFSGEALTRQNITQTSDLTRLVPGAKFALSGSSANSTFYIRGQGRDNIGPISPSVMEYINEVPLPSWGNIVPTFDMTNIQVLKGPQGTLFGRNTTGGALLLYTKQPDYEFGGYLQGVIGSYNWKEAEGAINVPLVKDKLAVRVAAQSRARDGYTKSANGGFTGDDVDSEAYRISVLFEPTTWLKNVTVYDYSFATEHPASEAVSYIKPGGVGATFRNFPASFDCGVSPSCDVDLFLARQAAAGPRTYWANPGNPISKPKIQGVSNTTTADLGAITVKNIFGYRGTRVHSITDTDGTDMAMTNTESFHSDDQLSDELQFSGDVLGGSLHWLAGAFILQDVPGGPNAIRFDLFRAPTQNPDTWSYDSIQNQTWADRTHAFFGSLTQDLSAFVPGLKLSASGRYTWDSQTLCGVSVRPVSSTPAADFSGCRAVPGAFVRTQRSSKPTWQFGADYQATDNLLLYVVTRRGYRAGGNNSPTLGGALARYQTFQPQTVTDVEIGMKKDWRQGDWRGRVNLSAYYGKFDDYQRPVPGVPPNFDGDNNALDDPSNAAFDVNAGTAVIKGVDLDGFISPFQGFRLTFAGAWFDGKINPDSALGAISNLLGPNTHFDKSPKFSYSLGGQYMFPLQLLGGDLSANVDWYWSDHYKTSLVEFPSYHVANASLDLENIGGKGVDASFFVQNLTNEVYLSAASVAGSSPGIFAAEWAPPRMYGVKVRYSFSGL
jgi:iron complex outermembrane recepter protein